MGVCARVRWGNVARACAVIGALALVVAWPRLTGDAPVVRVQERPVAPRDAAREPARGERPARRRAGERRERARRRPAEPRERTRRARWRRERRLDTVDRGEVAARDGPAAPEPAATPEPAQALAQPPPQDAPAPPDPDPVLEEFGFESGG